MIAAWAAADKGNHVVLYEKNEKLGKKLYITGKGRCNITNTASPTEFFGHVPRNPRFLYSSVGAFPSSALVSLLNENGLPTQVERGGRVFPRSNKSSDVIATLSRMLHSSGVSVRLNTRVTSVEVNTDSQAHSVITANSAERYDAVIIATGGVSYSATGSTGDGYAFARALGHDVLPAKAALVPLSTREAWPRELMGLTLVNVRLSAYVQSKKLFDELGELLFTHFGVSGPLVLTLSSIIADAPQGVELRIDLKPGLDREELDRRLLRDLDKYKNKQMKNALFDLLPMSMAPIVLDLAGIDPLLNANSVTRAQRGALLSVLKGLPLTVDDVRPIDEAIITRGGVSTREIDPKTMESKLVKGLYFCGEVLDVDGFTGGFNLQIAFSTGFAAGRSV